MLLVFTVAVLVHAPIQWWDLREVRNLRADVRVMLRALRVWARANADPAVTMQLLKILGE